PKSCSHRGWWPRGSWRWRGMRWWRGGAWEISGVLPKGSFDRKCAVTLKETLTGRVNEVLLTAAEEMGEQQCRSHDGQRRQRITPHRLGTPHGLASRDACQPGALPCRLAAPFIGRMMRFPREDGADFADVATQLIDLRAQPIGQAGMVTTA